MRRADVFVHDMAHPEDCAGLARDLAAGRLRAADIRAVFIKTEGNGLDNDFSRPLALRALAPLLEGSGSAGGAPVMLVASGGCEGMLTPHMTVLASRDLALDAPDSSDTPDATGGGAGPGALAIGSHLSAPLQAADLGREAHALAARDAVLRACEDAGLAPQEVVSVQLLSPWMGSDLLAAAGPGDDLVARSPHASKPFIRGAAALGAAMALSELTPADIHWSRAGPACAGRASRVAVTAGDTGGRLHALVLGHGSGWSGPLRAAGAQLADMLDLQAIASVRRGEVVAAFFKGDPPEGGRLRGARTTMASDSDIHAFRHFRAAMSGVFGAALGTPRVFIGGGAEFQCVAGGGLLTTIFHTGQGPKEGPIP